MNRNTLLIIGGTALLLTTIVVCTAVITTNQKKIVLTQNLILQNQYAAMKKPATKLEKPRTVVVGFKLPNQAAA